MSLPDSCYEESGMLFCERRGENNSKKNKKNNSDGKSFRGEQSTIEQKQKGSKIKSLTVC